MDWLSTTVILVEGQEVTLNTLDLPWIYQSGYRLSIGSHGYVVLGGDFLLHRLILGLRSGDPLCGDHINQDKLDNRSANLRKVTQQENKFNIHEAQCNSKTGLRGVVKLGGKYRATIMTERRQVHLGYFVTKEEARAAYLEAKAILHKVKDHVS